MTRMTGPDCAVMCNFIIGLIKYTYIHTYCTSRESVSPLSRLIRGFRNKYHWSPLGRINASGIE